MGLEERLCLLLARWPLSPQTEAEAQRLLAQPVAWPRLMKLVRTHEVLPLVYCSLKSFGFAGVAQPIQRELTDIFRHNAARNLLLAAELARVLRVLAEAGVPATPLKGIPLAERLYGDTALRVCSDIDLLVPLGHFAAAFQSLASAGYEAEFSLPKLVCLTARYGKDAGLMRQDGAQYYPLQLHAGLIWGGPVERRLSEEIWSDARATSFLGARAFALSAEWEFLYLAVHAARHGMFPLKWLVDLDRLCRLGKVNWEEAKRKARRLGWEEVITSALSVCQSLLETAVPACFQIEGASDRRREAATLRESSHAAIQIPRETLFAIRLLNSPLQKLHFAAIRLFVPTAADCGTIRLPASLFFLYYALRPLRLAITVAGRFFSSRNDKRGQSAAANG